MEALQKGLADGELTDFTITCGHNTFAVHKAVIAAQSKYFKSACSRDYAEGHKNRIDLKAIGSGEDDDGCDDPEAIRLMVQFFYYAHYSAEELPKVKRKIIDPEPEPKPLEVPPEPMPVSERCEGCSSLRKTKKKARRNMWEELAPAEPLEVAVEEPAHAVESVSDGNVVMHAKVFAAAVKYQIPPLQQLASTNFAKAAKCSWSHHSFVEAARIAYTTTPEEIRDVRDTVAATLHNHDSLLDSARIESLLLEVQPLHFELLRMARGKPAVASKKADDRPICAACGGTVYFVECQACGKDYMGCCYDRCEFCGRGP